jgi:hypothetical protein
MTKGFYIRTTYLLKNNYSPHKDNSGHIGTHVQY